MLAGALVFEHNLELVITIAPKDLVECDFAAFTVSEAAHFVVKVECPLDECL